MRAPTLVWDRRAVGCFHPGCGATALTLTNLELEQLDPQSGALEARSASAIDNVEQVRSPGTGDVIYKVKAATSVDGLSAEPYALAARRQLRPLTTPVPSVRTTLSRAAVRPGDEVTVVAEISNPSPDLTAETASATLDLPAGVELAPGAPSATRALGTLATGESRTVTWTIRAAGDGPHRIRVRGGATRYGESFATDDAATLLADGTPPSIALSAPAGELAASAIPLTWTAADTGVGVSSHDVDVSADGAAFEPWLAATTTTSSTYHGLAGHTYRFRARARDGLGSTSDYVTSDEIRIASPRAADPPILPPVFPVQPITPNLRVVAVTRRGGIVRVRGKIESSAARPIEIRGSVKRRGKRRSLSASARPLNGRFAASLRMRKPASGTITLRYAGDARLSPQTIRVKLRGV
jgi:hypothetical protein